MNSYLKAIFWKFKISFRMVRGSVVYIRIVLYQTLLASRSIAFTRFIKVLKLLLFNDNSIRASHVTLHTVWFCYAKTDLRTTAAIFGVFIYLVIPIRIFKFLVQATVTYKICLNFLLGIQNTLDDLKVLVLGSYMCQKH